MLRATKKYPPDGLNPSNMNVYPGGKQAMRDTVWNDQIQKMSLPDGTATGTKMVVQERGVNVVGMNAEKMSQKLNEYSDFSEQPTIVEELVHSRGHICLYFPKYHCELNPSILLEFSNSLATSSLQFGFKSSMSTTLCTGLVKNVVAHYMSRGSPVFACLLDASKAFDLVEHSLLFQQLLDRKVPNFLVRFLLSRYSTQCCTVSWDGSISDLFLVSNGVRQGGVLSPVLFTIYAKSS